MRHRAREHAPPQETWSRLVVKAIEWRLTGVLLGAVIGYLVTDSWRIGVLFGGVYNVVRLALMPLRDRLWNRVRWGVRAPALE